MRAIAKRVAMFFSFSLLALIKQLGRRWEILRWDAALHGYGRTAHDRRSTQQLSYSFRARRVLARDLYVFRVLLRHGNCFAENANKKLAFGACSKTYDGHSSSDTDYKGDGDGNIGDGT